MQLMKKMAMHIYAVARGMLFIGFSVQIILGVIWMCCNFGRIQDFGEPDSALYRWLFHLFGEHAAPLYLMQLALAGLAGYCFLRGWQRALSGEPREEKREKAFNLWKVLALLTFPFAMQCHLALLPYSFAASLFLLSFLSLCRTIWAGRERGRAETAGREKDCAETAGREKDCAETAGREKGRAEKTGGKKTCGGNGRRAWRHVGAALLFVGAALALLGAFDADRREEKSGDSFEAAMARRIAWPTLWNDFEEWPEELRELARSVVWEASYYPGNMNMLQTLIESSVDAETAGKYYRQMTEAAWRRHAPAVIKQIVWDVLGYAVTPIVFPLQLAGRAYDSCTGRNYEIMRGNTPVLTRYYVDYGCWWFRWSLVLAAVLFVVRFCLGRGPGGKGWILPAALCVCQSCVWIALLTARGAGIMDYKYSIMVNELWLAGELLLMGGFDRPETFCGITDQGQNKYAVHGRT